MGVDLFLPPPSVFMDGARTGGGVGGWGWRVAVCLWPII